MGMEAQYTLSVIHATVC